MIFEWPTFRCPRSSNVRCRVQIHAMMSKACHLLRLTVPIPTAIGCLQHPCGVRFNAIAICVVPMATRRVKTRDHDAGSWCRNGQRWCWGWSGAGCTTHLPRFWWPAAAERVVCCQICVTNRVVTAGIQGAKSGSIVEVGKVSESIARAAPFAMLKCRIGAIAQLPIALA